MFYYTWQRTWRFFDARPMFAENSPVPSDFFPTDDDGLAALKDAL